MGSLGKVLNKSLFPIDGKAIISRIIEKFPVESEFVVGLGFLGDQVRQYLGIAHPHLRVTFVEVENFDGPGSGPGHSLLCCKDRLQRPFYFVSCDTLWETELDFDSPGNWLGVAPISSTESVNYCNLKIEDDSVVELRDKRHVDDPSFRAFIGLCCIKDFVVFWNALANAEAIAGEHQVSNGIQALIDRTRVEARAIDWSDVGDLAKYEKAVRVHENYDFSKQNEALYIVNGRVIKFFADAEIVWRRVAKAELNTAVFPPIRHHSAQFYSYEFQRGETLYKANSPRIFQHLLQWLWTKLWLPKSVAPEVMRATCQEFYEAKTRQRLKMYFTKYAVSDAASRINGKRIPATSELLGRVPWERLGDGIPCFMHGDLQFDNILYDESTDAFTLLDWRQDFGGQVDYGDLYYDFAKLYGGIFLNYDYIKLNLLTYSESGEDIHFDFAQRFQTGAYLRLLSEHLRDRGYDVSRVKIIVALIYLNMSPLHHYPFDKMLYSLGRELLHAEVGNETEPAAGSS